MFIYAFTCDICGATESATPTDGFWSYRLPEGWRSIDRRHCCTLACVGRYASDPESFPRQQLDPDPMVTGIRKAFEKKVPNAAPSP